MYLLFPDGRELLGLLVVTSKTVDSALDKNQPELGVLVFPVPLKVLADGHCFLDQVVEILRDLRSKTMSFQDSQNLVSGNTLHLRDTVRVTKNDTNLRWCQTLLCKLADGLINLFVHHKHKTNQSVNTFLSKHYQSNNPIIRSFHTSKT